MKMRSSTARGLTATTAIAIATAVILLASNFTITNAQQQSLTSQQPSAIQNGRTTTAATTFQSTNDSFSIEVPQGWVIQDLNNTGSVLLNESSQGYGILAQLCPEEEQQQGAALPNSSGGSTNSRTSSTASCQGSEQVIYVIRYPDLDTRIRAATNVTTTINNNNITTDDVVSYHLQKLQEVGYRSPQIVNSTEVRLNLTNPQTDQPIAIVPAKLVEIAYSTNSAPNEIRTGYFISTATNGTPPNLGTTKGYAVFYEGNSTNSTTAAEITTATAASGSLAPTPPPTPVRQVFDSFELIAAPEVAQTIAQDAQAAETSQSEDDGANDDNGGSNDNNNNDDDDNNDDNGGSNDNNNNDDDGEDGGGTSNQGKSTRGPEHNSDDYDPTADDEQTNGDCDGC
jgi:hypothetical protein